MRKVVFVGNCQGRRLQALYEETFAYLNGDTTDFVVSYYPPTDDTYHTLRTADVIVAQAINSEHPVNVHKIDTSARIIEFPNVTGVFLWPYAGVEHVRNETLPHYKWGPFEHGDRWLNQRIQAGVPPADIIDEYLNLDIPKAANLDRLYEIHIELARERDARTGFDITPVIERRLTEEKLFRIPENLELPLFRALARGVYERLGVPTSATDRGLDSLWHAPFPPDEIPVHPSVARHFGLKFITPETRYRYCTGEQFTFNEWLERYVRYEWNDALLRAINQPTKVHHYDADAAAKLNLLQEGLQASSGSDTGYATLAHLLVLKGDNDAALETFRKLEAFDPINPAAPINVAHQLAERGDLAEAEHHVRAVTLTWPCHADGWARLAVIRERRGDGPGAIKAIRRAVALEPRAVHLLVHHVHLFVRFGRAKDAFEAFYNAIKIDPNNVLVYAACARLEADHGRFQDALAHIEEAIRLAPDNSELLAGKAEILVRSGDLEAAEAGFVEVLALAPDNGQLHVAQALLLIDLGRYQAAMESVRNAVRLNANKSVLLGQLADRLARSGRLTEAAGMYREAIERDWTEVELIGGLGHVLLRQGDTVGAVLALHRAIQLRPHDPDLYYQVAELMMRHNDFASAATTLDNARRFAPPDAHVLGLQALVFLRQGKLPPALEAVTGALEIDPHNPHLTARRALILSEMGDYADAEQVLNEAIAILPTASGFHALLGTLMLRQGRKSDARVAYRDALRYEPDHAGYRSQLEQLAEV